jgi:hypothetical protein
MTGRTRTEIRLSVSGSGAQTTGGGNPMRYDIVNFDVGLNNDNYDEITCKYTVPLSGVCIIGYSYIKLNAGAPGRWALVVTRDGVNIDIQTTVMVNDVPSTTLTGCVFYKLKAGDLLFLQSRYGIPRVNLGTITTDDILNSFWGIRLDYDIVNFEYSLFKKNK